MSRVPLPRWRMIAVALVMSVVAAGCGGGDDPLEIGFRRIALDLAFKDADKADPADDRTIVRRFVDGDDFTLEELEPEPRVVRRVRVVTRPAPRVCDKAPEGATPEHPAFAVVKDPPKVGQYPRHNEGKLTINSATTSYDIPLPALSRWEIPAVRFVRGHRAISDRDIDSADPPEGVRNDPTVFAELPEFELTRRILPGYSTTDTYRYTQDASGGDFLYLVKRVTVALGEESVFEPSPPIRIVRLNVPEGDIADAGVVHGGVDRTTDVAMTVQSQILDREVVDVCGEVVDTYRVQIKEQFVDFSKSPPETSGNEGDTSNFWNIQFDNGLLIVREEVHTTLRTTATVLGQQVPITVDYDYLSTLDRLGPDPLPAAGER